MPYRSSAPLALVLGLTACGSHQTNGAAATKQLPDSCTTLVLPADQAYVVDDFEDGDEWLDEARGVQGRWYVENDGSGTQEPAPGASGALLITSPGTSASPGHALHSSASGFTRWGAFVGVHLNQALRWSCVVDAAALTGIALSARGSGNLRVNVGTPATTPVASGGECRDEPCSDYGSVIELSEDWQTFELAFGALRQPDWAAAAEWQPERLERISFWSEQGSLDLWLDDVQLY